MSICPYGCYLFRVRGCIYHSSNLPQMQDMPPWDLIVPVDRTAQPLAV